MKTENKIGIFFVSTIASVFLSAPLIYGYMRFNSGANEAPGVLLIFFAIYLAVSFITYHILKKILERNIPGKATGFKILHITLISLAILGVLMVLYWLVTD